MHSITPRGGNKPFKENINETIQHIFSKNNQPVLTMKNTCLDPDLYGLMETGSDIRYHTASQSLNDIAPAILNGAAEATLLDIPYALIALHKYPGEIKIIG
jgi:hypothetical protein